MTRRRQKAPARRAPAALRVEVLTIFPELVARYCSEAIFGRAIRAGVVDLAVHDLRLAATDPHRSVDDAPFGGGAGMVLAPEPVFAAVERVGPVRPLYLLSPAGRRLDQNFVEELQARGAFSLLCGRYEGVDERIVEHLVDGEISIGDFVLAGGELAALAVVEAVVRLVPGVVGNEASPRDESFTTGLLEYPQYTRPAEFRGWPVPEVLRSGDHVAVARWRLAAALARTIERRPDLVAARGGLTEAEVRLLVEHGYPLDAAAPLATAERAGGAPPRRSTTDHEPHRSR
jgi:tRNA (guanine37-N1)-methyltransferase